MPCFLLQRRHRYCALLIRQLPDRRSDILRWRRHVHASMQSLSSLLSFSPLRQFSSYLEACEPRVGIHTPKVSRQRSYRLSCALVFYFCFYVLQKKSDSVRFRAAGNQNRSAGFEQRLTQTLTREHPSQNMKPGKPRSEIIDPCPSASGIFHRLESHETYSWCFTPPAPCRGRTKLSRERLRSETMVRNGNGMS
jgi:hypothetical protein